MITNWDDLRCFIAVAKTGRLTAAARQLGLSQPTVGRRVKSLEKQLDSKLLSLLKEKYTLTPAGQRVFDIAQNFEQNIVDIEQCVSIKEQEPAGRVSIATTDCIASTWLATKLPELTARYPKIEIQLLSGISNLDLMRKEADIALRIGTSGSNALLAKKVGVAEFGLFASKDYLKNSGEPKKTKDLQDHQIIEAVQELDGLPQTRLLRELARAAEVSFACNQVIAQRNAACNGLGIVALPHHLTVGKNQLKRVLKKEFSIQREMWLLTHHDSFDTPCYRLLWDYLAGELEKDKTVFSGQD